MTLPSVLDPYSVWVLSHRNTVIVVLGLILFAVACHSLIMHWRVESLERDRSRPPGRSDRFPVYAPGRPAAAAQPDPEPAQPGGLPPVRGGRTYARNLGSALQKSSAAPTAPIYSPPTPAGWSPNAAQQPGRPAAPYSPTPAPWGAPAPPPPMAWPPMGPGGGPAAAPLGGHPNQPGMPQAPPGPPQAWPGFTPVQPSPAGMPMPSPGLPGQPGPGPFAAPSQGFPAFGQGASGPAVVSPQVAPPASSVGAGPHPAIQAAPVEAPAQETGKRGKPKRRRFNFSVLEGIEKKIQSLPSSLPRAAAPAVPDQASAAAAAAPAPPRMPTPPAVPAPAAAPMTVPAGESMPPAASAGTPVEEETKPAVAEPGDAEASRPARSKSSRERRSPMRSMMFGEEPVSVPAPPEPGPIESAETPAPSAEGPIAAVDAVPPAPPARAESEPVETGSVAEEPSFAFTPLTADREATGDAAESVAASQPEMTFEVAPSQASDSESSSGAPSAVEPASDVAGQLEPEPPAVDAAAVTDEAFPPSQRPEPEVAAAPFPIEAEAAAEPPSMPAEERKPSAGTMVIIEDDPSVAEYYATLFRGNGYRVEVAHDGVSGVDLCVRVEPDVILLDVMMPRQNGILVLQTLRASDETRNTPVVVLSNFSEPTLIKRALQLGALEYVIKTQVEGSALLQAVPRWMSRERAFAAA